VKTGVRIPVGTPALLKNPERAADALSA